MPGTGVGTAYGLWQLDGLCAMGSLGLWHAHVGGAALTLGHQAVLPAYACSCVTSCIIRTLQFTTNCTAVLSYITATKGETDCHPALLCDLLYTRLRIIKCTDCSADPAADGLSAVAAVCLG